VIIFITIILLSVFSVVLLTIDDYKSKNNLKEFTYLKPSDIREIHINYMFSAKPYLNISDKSSIKDIFYSINIENIKYYKERRNYPISINIVFSTQDNKMYTFELFLDNDHDSFCGFYVDKTNIPIDGIDINRTLKKIIIRMK